MKHLKVMLLPIALAAVSMTAMAQSNVKISGRVDLGFGNVPSDLTKGTTKQSKVDDSSTGRLNFSGVEQISADLSAFFALEMRFKADTGAQDDANALFKDKAWVGLNSKQFGEVKLGRMSSPLDAVVIAGRYEAFGGDSYASMGSRGAAIAAKWNNAIYYTTPTYSGFNAGVAAQTSETYYGSTATRASGQGFHIQYANGPFSTAFGYQKEQDTKYTTDGNGMSTIGFGANYDFGVATLMTTYARSTDLGLYDGGKETVFTIGARIPMGPGQLRTSYRKIDDTNIASATSSASDKDSTKYSVGYHYPLSKQTSINLSLAHEQKKTYNANGSIKTDYSGTGWEVALRKSF